MRTITRLACAVAVAILFAGSTARAAQPGENLQLGTWVMNIPKSKFSAGTGFKSASVTITAVDGGVKHTVSTIYIDGTARNYDYTTYYDGKDQPVNGNSPWGDTTAVTRVDAHTTKTVYKTAGKVTVIQTSVVSIDGRTRTVTTKGTSPAGQPVDNLSVYDKKS